MANPFKYKLEFENAYELSITKDLYGHVTQKSLEISGEIPEDGIFITSQKSFINLYVQFRLEDKKTGTVAKSDIICFSGTNRLTADEDSDIKYYIRKLTKEGGFKNKENLKLAILFASTDLESESTTVVISNDDVNLTVQDSIPAEIQSLIESM